MSKTEDILEQIRKTKEVMLKNMDALLQRGEKLNALKDKTDDMNQQAKLFAEAAYELQKRAKNRYFALTFVLIGMSLGIVVTLAYGYSMPIAFIGATVGAIVGLIVDKIRSKIADFLFKNPYASKPTAGVDDKDKKPNDLDLESKLSRSNHILHAYGNHGSAVSNPASAVAKEAAKLKLGL